MEIEDSGYCYRDRRFRWLLWRYKIQVVVMGIEDTCGCYGYGRFRWFLICYGDRRFCYRDSNPSSKALG